MLLDELDVRRAAMAYLAELMASSGGVVTRAQLEAFSYDGEQLKLIDQSRGIRNPRQLNATLSILSQPKGPYDDVETEDGLLRYAYRDGDPNSGDNRKLRRAAELGLPLVLGVRRDYVVEVRPDVLLEIDGPMLKQGIQDVHGWTLELPKRTNERPDRDLLEQRWRVFSSV